MLLRVYLSQIGSKKLNPIAPSNNIKQLFVSWIPNIFGPLLYFLSAYKTSEPAHEYKSDEDALKVSQA